VEECGCFHTLDFDFKTARNSAASTQAWPSG
jgi:hypothetical protein